MGDPKRIVIDDGCEEYVFENKLGEVFAKFTFNPTDTALTERFNEVEEELSNISFDENKDTVEQITDINTLLKNCIDKMFNRDMRDVWIVYQPLTLLANGDFWYEVFCENVGGIVGATMKTRLGKKLAKIKKLNSKYHN